MLDNEIEAWRSAVASVFPKDARIRPEHDDNTVFRISWVLKDDPSRPKKVSRTIRLVISEEAISDCSDIQKARLKVQKILQERLKGFDPDPKNHRGDPPPVENWLITASEMICS